MLSEGFTSVLGELLMSASKKRSLASPGKGPQRLSVGGVWPDSFSQPAELKRARIEA